MRSKGIVVERPIRKRLEVRSNPLARNSPARAHILHCSFDEVMTERVGEIAMLERVEIVEQGRHWEFATAKEKGRCWGVREERCTR